MTAARVTIVNGNDGDDTVIVDGVALSFPVEPLLPDTDVWAVQWDGSQGEVEYTSKPNEQISSMADYQPILDEYDRQLSLQPKIPAPSPEDDVRAERNSLLFRTDYLMLADSPVSDQSAWMDYRQLLRDVPDQDGFPDNIQWPVAPDPSRLIR